MFIHLPLIHFAPPPRWLIDFKNSEWLTYFCILLCICYCFSHLIGLLFVTWLSLLYKFTRFFIYFLFLSDEGPMLETLDYTIRIRSTPTFLYFDLYLYSAYAAHFPVSLLTTFSFTSGRWLTIPNITIFADNAAIHHTQEAIDTINATGALVILLPTYSPDFMRCEELFSQTKSYIRQNVIAWQNCPDPELMVFDSFLQIVDEEIRSYIKHACGLHLNNLNKLYKKCYCKFDSSFRSFPLLFFKLVAR